jgi:hypothetical protein
MQTTHDMLRARAGGLTKTRFPQSFLRDRHLSLKMTKFVRGGTKSGQTEITTKVTDFPATQISPLRKNWRAFHPPCTKLYNVGGSASAAKNRSVK